MGRKTVDWLPNYARQYYLISRMRCVNYIKFKWAQFSTNNMFVILTSTTTAIRQYSFHTHLSIQIING